MALGRKTGGRQKGTANKRTIAQQHRAASSGMLPHEFLLAVSRGETIGGHTPDFDERLQAAKDAAPYFAPKLAAVEHAGPNGGPIQTQEVKWTVVDPATEDRPRLRAIAGGKPV